MNIICELFGHNVHPANIIVHEIKANKFNKGRCQNIIVCRRCDWQLDLNDKNAIVEFGIRQGDRTFFKTLWKFVTGKL